MLGGDGNISVTANVAPDEMGKLCSLDLDGEGEVARPSQASLLHMVEATKPKAEAAEPNYRELERPTNARQQATSEQVAPAQPEFDLLDIPAFLRRQAD